MNKMLLGLMFVLSAGQAAMAMEINPKDVLTPEKASAFFSHLSRQEEEIRHEREIIITPDKINAYISSEKEKISRAKAHISSKEEEEIRHQRKNSAYPVIDPRDLSDCELARFKTNNSGFYLEPSLPEQRHKIERDEAEIRYFEMTIEGHKDDKEFVSNAFKRLVSRENRY